MLKNRKRRDIVGVRVAVGEPGVGKKPPRQLDHFTVTEATPDTNGVYRPIQKDAGKSLRIFVDSDEVEDFMKQRYECRMKGSQGVVLFCSGDGERARRLVAKGEWKDIPCRAAPPREDGTGWKERMPKDLAPLLGKPTSDDPKANDNMRCPFAQNGNPQSGPACKPRTELYFRLPDFPTVSSYARFTSGSHRTADNLWQGFTRILEVTRGVLQGVPLKLVLQRTRLQRPGGGFGVHSIVYPDLDVPAEQALKLAQSHLQEKAMLERGVVEAKALLEAPPEAIEAEEAEWESHQNDDLVAELVEDEKPSASFGVDLPFAEED